jgi:hypothetical protein
MKKVVVLTVSVLILSLSVFSVSFLTPEAGIVEEGYIYIDTFNPAWGLRWGLFGFIETGVSQVNNGGYIKAGVNNVQDIPIKFSVAYSTLFGIYSSVTSAIGYETELIYFDVGGMFTQQEEYNSDTESYDMVNSYGAFAKTSLNIIQEENSESFINLESGLGFDENFSLKNYMISLYGVQNYYNKIWIFDGINLYAGLQFANDVGDEIVLVDDMQIVLGLSSRIKIF